MHININEWMNEVINYHAPDKFEFQHIWVDCDCEAPLNVNPYKFIQHCRIISK